MISNVKEQQRVIVEPSDWELVQKCHSGETGPFQELVARYHQKVFMVILGILNHREDALEVAQETFYKAFRKIRGFRSGSAFYTWLYRIAVNQCIDFQRRQKRSATELRESMDELPDNRGNIGRNPHDALQSREFIDGLFAALDELTPDHKAVIVLRAIEGLSYKDISEILGCSEGTVMSRLHYARKNLEQKLAPFL